jgi:hypothetical protein
MGRVTRTAIQVGDLGLQLQLSRHASNGPRWHPKPETGLIPCRYYTERAAVRFRNLVGDLQTQP